ncbi:MAG: invasion associated locus B family protein [Rhodospirillaceae bacterium]|nr:invasion associated locus B family protein [Rhodospirillaceae bacterium]
MTSTPIARFVLAATLVLAAGLAQAETPKAELIGKFDDWTAASFEEQAGKGCFVVSVPKKSEGKYTRRDPTYVHVTHRPAMNTRDVVSVTAGYTYKPGSTVKVTIGDETFTLFTKEGAAWADDALDAKLVEAMKKGDTMVVEGTSSRGTLTTDTYSLAGFTAAYEAIGKACPPR